MYKTRIRFVVIPLVVALGFPGCEYLGPVASKRTQLPASLATGRNQGPEFRPLQTEPLAAEPPRPAEHYPATGRLLGPGAAPERRAPKEGKYTLNFDDADLSEVAKTILDETLKINYVLSPKVTGKVTLQTSRPLADDELIPTLEMLLKMNGAVLIKDGDMYRIEPDATATMDAPGAKLGLAGQSLPPGYQLRVVPLRFVGVKEMQKVLEPLMPPKSIVRVDEARNILMLAGTAEELEGVIETIRLFDVDFMRGMSVALFPLKNVEPATIAEELDKVLGDTAKGPLAGLIRLLPIERLNAILAVSAQPRYLDEVEAWVQRLDRYTTHRAGGVHVYRVQNVDAVELANTLSNIFGGAAGGRGGRPSLSPGQQGAQIGGAYGTGGVYGTGGAFGTGGGLGTTGGITGGSGGGLGSASGDLSSGGGGSLGTMGTSGSGLSSGGGSLGGLGGASSGMQGTTGLGGSSAGVGGGGGFAAGGGGFGGGIGRGTTGGVRGGRGTAAMDLGNVRIVADPTNNALIITARAQDYKEIEAVIKELDVLPLQVLIDATIVEVTLTGRLRYGLQWYFAHSADPSGAGVLGDMSNLTAPLASAFGGGFTYSLVTNAQKIRVELDLLAKDNKVNVISSPSVMSLNNQEAQIMVGTTVPIATSQTYGTLTTTAAVTSGFQYVDTGTILHVRPRVNAGGLVTMEVRQEVSAAQPVAIGNTNTNQISKRTISSAVAVNSGGTLVLGGLITDNRTTDVTGIPILSQIPYLGSLFGTTDKNLTRTELVVLLTPRVVQQKRELDGITQEFKRKLTGLYEELSVRPAPPPAR